MKAKDEKWVLGGLTLVFLVVIVITNLAKSEPWYSQIEDFQINPIPPAVLASWIITEKNDFYPVYVKQDGDPAVENIPKLTHLKPGLALKDQIKGVQLNKTWVVLTADGKLSDEVAHEMTKNWKRHVVLLQGGVKAWQKQISASNPDLSGLSRTQIQQVQEVRPFFHQSQSKKRQRYLAPATKAPSLLKQEAEEEEEEGC